MLTRQKVKYVRGVGGVLGADAIDARSAELFAAGYSSALLQGASYDLRVATTKLILPSGKRVPEGSSYPYRFVLQPGEAAFVSSLERLRIPHGISGNISIKFSYASQGILVLAGMIVDPGYGMDLADGRRLHFILANVGHEALSITPGEDRIASLQFLSVVGSGRSASIQHPPIPRSPTLIDELFHNHDKALGLAFFTSLKELDEQVKLSSRVIDDHVKGLNQIVLFGHFLLGTAILGVVLTVLLGWVGDASMTARVERFGEAMPDSAWGSISMIAVIVSVFFVAPASVFWIRDKLSSSRKPDVDKP